MTVALYRYQIPVARHLPVRGHPARKRAPVASPYDASLAPYANDARNFPDT